MITQEKIIQIRPNLTTSDFMPSVTATIVLRDDADGYGARIAQWNHPTETQPTQEELDAIE